MRHRYATQAKRNASTERWLVSYADYMTLMFALFVVLYAMAIANENEYSSNYKNMDLVLKNGVYYAEPYEIFELKFPKDDIIISVE